MKSKNIFLGVILTAIAFSGCDVVTQPLVQKQVNGTLPSTPPTFRDSSTNYNVYKVLLEDYMGHLCSNCPPAVETGDGLIASSNPLSSQIVLIEIHNGNFADTTTRAGVPDSAFRKDYTSQAGNNWLTEFSIAFWPWGQVDRTLVSGSTYVNYANWQSDIQALINANSSPSVTINIHDSCWVPQRIIGVEFQVTFKKAIDTVCNLAAVIIQDSIFDWQADATVPSQYDTNFDHRNVLRGAFDGTGNGIGIPTTISNVAGGTWTSYQTYNFKTGENGKAAGSGYNPPWNMARCRIVAFVYNSVSKRVIQAEMINVE